MKKKTKKGATKTKSKKSPPKRKTPKKSTLKIKIPKKSSPEEINIDIGPLKKPSKKKIPHKRIQTGIKNLDKLIEGGFEYNSTNTVVGGAGSGKTILATQFLIDGIKRGERCLYVTFEEKKSRFYKNMKKFGWDLEKHEKKDLFTFLEYTPIKVKTMLEEGGGSIETLVISKKITRMVIDSITSFALLFEDELSKREAGLALFNMIRKWSCTSLLTLEEEPSITKKPTSSPLQFESDSIMLLYFTRSKGKRSRHIEILKMRGTKHSKMIHSFTIEKNGINIEKKPVKNFP